MRIFIFCIMLFLLSPFLKAKEGMWIPLLLDKYTIEDMQKEGFRLTAEDIYSINHSSLKDAVVIFGGGCTGEIISPEGLLFTNHHCALGMVHNLSTKENNYVDGGFWAKSKEEEIPVSGLKVTFLERIEDVTDIIYEGLNEYYPEEARQIIINSNIEKLVKEASNDQGITANVESFYYGNAYYLFVYKEFTDVRLVGIPPLSVGNFGGDTDNWVWPRHSGDFSIFRIYADKNNLPSKQSVSNIPYTSKKYFPISIEGISEGDFTFVMGYPGYTQEYLYSDAVEYLKFHELPTKIMLRDIKMDVYNREMALDNDIRMQYLAQKNKLSNAWKKWQGMLYGFEKSNVIEVKRTYEKEFQHWFNEEDRRKEKYENIYPDFSQTYKSLEPVQNGFIFLTEGIFSLPAMNFSGEFVSLINLYNQKGITGISKQEEEKLNSRVESYFKKYNLSIEKEIFVNTLLTYCDSLPEELYPHNIKQLPEENHVSFFNTVFDESILNSKNDLLKILNPINKKTIKKISSDPLFQLYNEFGRIYYNKVREPYISLNNTLDSLYRIYMSGIIEFEDTTEVYSDANFTMRLTYGNVNNYRPFDAITYNWYTTTSGILQKEDTINSDYIVFPELKKIIHHNDYYPYVKDSIMPVCFIASNHTSGGNSGSPVLNANGHLVGINFDRNWEGTMSDIHYDESICRNIAVDIRYVLFIIDKLGKADYLFDEMEILGLPVE